MADLAASIPTRTLAAIAMPNSVDVYDPQTRSLLQTDDLCPSVMSLAPSEFEPEEA